MATRHKHICPASRPTGFPTVKSSVCQSKEALEFLRSLDLREPDPVDYAIRNILPKYDKDLVLVSDDSVEVYRGDLAQALNAYESASREQRQLLAGKIGKVKFAIAVDAATGDRQFVRPGDAYWPTDSLKALFKGVPGVLLLDDNIVHGEAHNLLAAAGNRDRLTRKRVNRELTEEEKYSIRLRVSDGNCRYDIAVRDYTLMGLDALLRKMASMPFEQASEKAKLLWETLCEFSNRSNSAFNGEYRWHYRREKYAKFRACFVERLRNEEWVPDKKGKVRRCPGAMAFVDTEWEANPSLAEEIGFPSSDVDIFAENKGIDREALHYFVAYMKNSNITLAQLKARLPKNSEATNDGFNTGEMVSETGDGGITGHRQDLTLIDRDKRGGITKAADNRGNVEQVKQPGLGVSLVRRTSSEGGSGEEPGDGSQGNMAVECAAIKLILSLDPSLKWTMPGNPGFDLWEPGPNDNPVLTDAAEDRRELGPGDQPKRWIEVKSTAGQVSSVTMTGTQFGYALERQDAYWLYVVENATSPKPGPILKIQNPAQKILNAFDFNLSSAWIGEHQSRDNPEEG